MYILQEVSIEPSPEGPIVKLTIMGTYTNYYDAFHKKKQLENKRPQYIISELAEKD